MAISQLPNVLERSVKAQIEGRDVRYLCTIIGHLYFTLGLFALSLWREGVHDFSQALQVTVLKTNGGRAYTETIYFLTLTHDISAAL